MQASAAWKLCLGTLVGAAGVGLFVLAGASCGSAPTPFLVNGPGQLGNDPPTLSITEPIQNITRPQGAPLLIRWTDTDSDDNAQISFELVSTTTNARVPLVAGLDENDLSAPDTVTVGTSLVPQGSFNLLGTIADGTNPIAETFATIGGVENAARVVIRITGEGEGQQSVPPTLVVIEPAFNLSITQDDRLRVAVVPSALGEDPNRPFDPDSDITLFLILDLDQDPNNDDPSNPRPDEIILLEARPVTQGDFEAQVFEINVDLDIIPARLGGLPYYIRVTADDLENRPVHRYAVGQISVVQLASGLVDLAQAGSIISGARFYGFNPGALTGSSIAGITDFDLDGADDFVIVAQRGNPRNLGPIGEAYLIYGQVGDDPTEPGIRFGGSLPVNSVSQTISGVIFEAPPVRTGQIPASNARTDGITDVSYIRALPDDTAANVFEGDGRPELLFGLPHIHGAFEGMDFDPGDDNLFASDTTVAIEVVLRQGRRTISEDDDEVSADVNYRGVEDTTITNTLPTSVRGFDLELNWQNDALANNQSWTLIKFAGVLDQLPDRPAEIEAGSVTASLQLRLFRVAGAASMHESFKPFSTQTTYDSYAGGGDPVEDVDYDGEQLGNVTAPAAGFVTVDVSDFVARLIDGGLQGSNDELRMILVATGADIEDITSVRSTEYPNGPDRPTLTIGYARLNLTGSDGCYPDELVNNRTTPSPDEDVQETAGGMAILFKSTNRDNNPRTSPIPERLDTTSIALELVGQESGPDGRWILDHEGVNQAGNIFSRADDYSNEFRIAGARFMAGLHDVVDHRQLKQPAREGSFGQNVASLPDVTADGVDEIVISAPRNERHYQDLFDNFGFQGTHWHSTEFQGSILVLPGQDYDAERNREIASDDNGNSVQPTLDQAEHDPFGQCTSPTEPRHLDIPVDLFEVFAEDIDDMLGGASSAGDFNQDGTADLLCGAYHNDRTGVTDSGAIYILYGRTVIGNFDLKNADDPILRAPMLRVRGQAAGDQIGWRQRSGLDVNGDRIDDVFFGSPTTDFGGIQRPSCAGDFTGDGIINDDDLFLADFTTCERNVGAEVFSDDSCKAFDYDNDGDIDEDDRCIFCCLSESCTPDPECVHGHGKDCCDTAVDNGFVGVIFGGVFTDGDREICQLGTTDLRGAVFFGQSWGNRAGMDVASAGDFDQDGFGDLLIAAPGERRLDKSGRWRLGVVYLIFGGTHLAEVCRQADSCTGGCSLGLVGTEELPGIVFLSPYVQGRPNEAAPITVAGIGDVNNDGFDDIAIGNPKADFIDLSFPQGPEAPGSDAEVGRRRNAGDAYLIYGHKR